MVDTIKYKQQNHQEQLQSEFEIPQIRCTIHQNYILECINLNTDSNNLLFCLRCVLENGLNFNDNTIVQLKYIFSKNASEIIQNWPPMQDYKEIKQQCGSEYKSKIESIFKKLRKDMTRIIDDHEEKVIACVNMIQDNQSNLFKIYNQISEKEEIKRQFCKNQNNLKELEGYLRKIISKKQKQWQENEQKVKDCLYKFMKSKQKLCYDHIQNVTQEMLENLKSIDFLKPIQSNTSENNNRGYQLNAINQMRKEQGNECLRECKKEVQNIKNEIKILEESNKVYENQLKQQQNQIQQLEDKNKLYEKQIQQYKNKIISVESKYEYQNGMYRVQPDINDIQVNRMQLNVGVIRDEQINQEQTQNQGEVFQDQLYLHSYENLEQYANYKKIEINLAQYIFDIKLELLLFKSNLFICKINMLQIQF